MKRKAKDKTQFNGRTAKYWICDDCAKDLGMICTKEGNTRMQGLCGWCKREDESLLTPVVDFKTIGKKIDEVD